MHSASADSGRCSCSTAIPPIIRCLLFGTTSRVVGGRCSLAETETMIRSLRSNPFHVLYASEFLEAHDFVHLFSPQLMAELRPLYMPGNIVLRGRQGSGKTMLLNLLEP